MGDILLNILMNVIQWPIIACLAAFLYLRNFPREKKIEISWKRLSTANIRHRSQYNQCSPAARAPCET